MTLMKDLAEVVRLGEHSPKEWIEKALMFVDNHHAEIAQNAKLVEKLQAQVDALTQLNESRNAREAQEARLNGAEAAKRMAALERAMDEVSGATCTYLRERADEIMREPRR